MSGSPPFSMNLFGKITHSKWFIRWSNWEYWPIQLANFPVVLIWLWFALRARKLFFFSAVNPVIETGGVLGESKYNIIKRIPQQYLPKTVFVKKGSSFQAVLKEIEKAGQHYPLLCKPNIGERGFLVKKIRSEADLLDYFENTPVDFLIQEFVDFSMEMSILHHLAPGAESGQTTSVCLKEFLTVTGDGSSSVLDLMKNSDRAKLQIERLEKDAPERLRYIPGEGEKFLIEPIGNHCRGTKFLNGNFLIDKQLSALFDTIMAQMEGIHYGRFDLKTPNVLELKKGNLKILEFNGVAGEPAHVYDPEMPVWKKYAEIYRHWKIIYRLYKIQAARGVRPMNLQEARQSLNEYFAYKKYAETTHS